MFDNSQAETLLTSRSDKSFVLACPTCGGKVWRDAHRIRGASVSRCLQCGLLGTTGFLEGITTTQGIYETSPEHHITYREQYLRTRLSTYERVLPLLQRFRKTGCLLEIGCSYGYFLEMARHAGWHAEGVEISEFACEVARSKGFVIHQGELHRCSIDLNSFDVIAMWDVIEHLTDPAEVVARCVELLTEGGALVARTPDAHALKPVGGLLGLAYRQLVYPANTPQHVFHFTPESLSALLEKKGFRQIEVDRYGGWEERIISGRSVIVRMGRSLIMRYAMFRQWPYEFLIKGVKGNASS